MQIFQSFNEDLVKPATEEPVDPLEKAAKIIVRRSVRTDIMYSDGDDSCDCKDACGQQCIDRKVYFECHAACKCGTICKNKRIQNGPIWTSALELFKTAAKGHGIRTNSEIPKDEFLMEYSGIVLTTEEYYKRQTDHTYGLHLDANYIIDAHQDPGLCKYVNHSCNPNCVMERWLVNGKPRMALFTKRDIDKDEELSFKYEMDNVQIQYECKCGEKLCQKFIGLVKKQ